jgi:hypothetical protein
MSTSSLQRCNMAVHAFPVRTIGSTWSTRDCKMGNNIKKADHVLYAEQLDPRAQTKTAKWVTISNVADQVTMLLLQNNGLRVLNQRD